MNLPYDNIEKQVILSKLMENFEKGKEYKEEEVYKILKSKGIDDFALFCRELVNFGYFNKDSYKSLYWVKTKKLSVEELEKIREWGKEKAF